MKTLVKFTEHYCEKYADNPYMWEKPRSQVKDPAGETENRSEKGKGNKDDKATRKVDATATQTGKAAVHGSASYQPTTYRQTLEQVHDFGAGLMALGVEPGERVALLSEGRNDWVISELAILFNGAINVPLSVKLSPVELQFRLFHSDASVLIISEGQLPKIADIRSNLPDLKQIILLDPQEHYGEDEISKNKVVRMGRRLLEVPGFCGAFDYLSFT